MSLNAFKLALAICLIFALPISAKPKITPEDCRVANTWGKICFQGSTDKDGELTTQVRIPSRKAVYKIPESGLYYDSPGSLPFHSFSPDGRGVIFGVGAFLHGSGGPASSYYFVADLKTGALYDVQGGLLNQGMLQQLPPYRTREIRWVPGEAHVWELTTYDEQARNAGLRRYTALPK